MNEPTGWKPALQAWLARVDALSDRGRAQWRRRRPARRRRVIVPYVGFGTSAQFTVTGRVLLDDGLRPALQSDSAFRNAARFFRQLESDEVPGATVVATWRESRYEATSDGEGYFQLDFRPDAPADAGHWMQVPLSLADAPADEPPTSAAVMIPHDSARFGIVSDIDDTVVRTHAADRMRMIWNLLRTNARTRKPFEGVAAFYRSLQRGASGDEGNPIFYVSSSPWNLYAPLVEYLDLQGIPLGPLLLKDFGDHTLFTSGDHGTHKLASIERVLATYPALPFVLIGDSGEQDPEIYANVVRGHPGRVKAIYIRNVSTEGSRRDAIEALIEEVRHSGAQLVLCADSAQAAAHAAGEGLISLEAAHEVGLERDEDHAAVKR